MLPEIVFGARLLPTTIGITMTESLRRRICPQTHSTNRIKEKIWDWDLMMDFRTPLSSGIIGVHPKMGGLAQRKDIRAIGVA
jgi:hypothetical protein